MAILDIFKRKKKIEKKEEIKKEVKKPPTPSPRPKKISEIASLVLKEPQVTEKATDLTQKNQYVFKVSARANKVDVKKAIEDLYGVNVVSVKTIKVPAKSRRLGRIEGERKGYKKAIVRLAAGQKIEVLPR